MYVPAAVALPVMVPLEDSFSPGGSPEPAASDHLYGGLPPAAVSVAVYFAFLVLAYTVPSERDVVVIPNAEVVNVASLLSLVPPGPTATTRKWYSVPGSKSPTATDTGTSVSLSPSD